MIIRVDPRHVDDCAKAWFELLKVEGDVLELSTPQRSHSLDEYEVRVSEGPEADRVSISVEEVGIRHEVPAKMASEALVDVFGSLLGYGAASLHGFTVRDSSGRKTKPTIRVFFRSVLGIRIPRELGHLKDDAADVPEVDESRMVPFVTTSPIIRSLLNSGPLAFSSEDTVVLLMLYNGVPVMVSDGVEVLPTVRATVSRANMAPFLALLKKFPFKFIDVFTKAYLMPSSAAINKELSNCFAEFQGSLTRAHARCICQIVSSAPVFLDARDKVTERIAKFYMYNGRGFRRRKNESGGYLEPREEVHIDRAPIGSLKRYAQDL